jgi:hypothetical protein
LKKILVFLLALAMMLALVPASAMAAESTVSDLAGLKAALLDPTVDTIVISGDITLDGTIAPARDITVRGAAGAAKPVITGAAASAVMFSCTGGNTMTLENLDLKLGANGRSFIYLDKSTAVVRSCAFGGAAGVTYGYNLIMGTGSAEETVVFTDNEVNLIFRNAINGLGNNSIVNNNVFNIGTETYPGGGRTSVLSLVADGTSGPIAVRGNTFNGANRVLAVDNASSFPADMLVFENNNFINTRYAFELSSIGNAGSGTYDLSNNYYIYSGVVGPVRVQDATLGGALTEFNAELGGGEYGEFITNSNALAEPYTGEMPEQEPADPTYTVSYHPNGGTGTVPMDMTRYYRGDRVTLASGAGLSKPGAVFLGWALADGKAVTSPYTVVSSNVTFFAVWGTASDLPEVPKTGDSASAFGFAMLFAGLAATAFALLKKRAAAK